jgi:uncharacterized protein YerC
MLNWNVAAASVQGTSHIKRSQPCQDACYWVVLDDNVLIAAVADGAGSVSMSEVGSTLAVQTAVEEIQERAERLKTLKNQEDWSDFFQDICHLTLNVLEAEANFLQVDKRELSTTLILVVATPDSIATAQIGDGAVVMREALDKITGLTNPNVEEFLEFTTFLTSPKALDSIQIGFWEGKVTQLAMFSDGLQLLALKMPEGKPHEPFFVPLFQAIAQEPDMDEMNKGLTKFLVSDRVTSKADDDLTLLIANLSTT